MIKVEKIIPGGQALGTYDDGRKIFFWNALPGELVVDYQITKQKPHYLEAIATKITQTSKFRITPTDQCFLSTSPWQIFDYNYELQTKVALVQEIFHQHHIELPDTQIATDYQDLYYRNKMEYSLYWDHDDNKIHLAFHQRGSHQKIPITQSSIERPEIFQAATKIIDQLNLKHESARKYQSLLLRCNQNGEISGGLFENHQPHPRFSPLTDHILGQSYSYSPNGFFQINLPVYELALREIKPYITTDRVLDLYSGVGTIGLSVARDHELTLVEVDRSAFIELCANITTIIGQLSINSKPQSVNDGIFKQRNLTAILAKSEEVLSHLAPNQTVILDPPRAGCDSKLINRLLETTPENIIYLSCNPATQARDISFLLSQYRIVHAKTFNFFPRTPHIENLVILKTKI